MTTIKITCKENLKRAIEFKKPFYLPVQLHFDSQFIIEKDKIKENKIDELVAQLVSGMHMLSTYNHSIGDVKTKGKSTSWMDE